MGKEIIKIIKIALEAPLDIIYPYDNKCIICGVEGFLGICSKCKSEIKRVHQQEEIMAYGYYGGVLKKLILNLKYHKSFIAGKVLADLLCQIIIEKKLSIDCICYVPISKDSLKKRGFNQCSVLAKNISSILDIPVIDCLVKVKETKEQKLLGKEERMKNILDAFEIKNKEKLFKKNILLIDDVYTTGATINECKKNIEKCNINKIYLLTIAKSNI
ncbi:MAG: ComF family protein [Clostridium sp.]|uniref:ComF family protein n=1 Tax=Clostridium sp. TaxID=1506 RepID=UPI0039958925